MKSLRKSRAENRSRQREIFDFFIDKIHLGILFPAAVNLIFAVSPPIFQFPEGNKNSI